MLDSENVIDYTPDSFGEMNSHDTRYHIRDPTQPGFKYNTNFILSDTGALNKLDINRITKNNHFIDEEYPKQFLDVTLRNEPLFTPTHRDLLIDESNHDTYGNTFNDP